MRLRGAIDDDGVVGTCRRGAMGIASGLDLTHVQDGGVQALDSRVLALLLLVLLLMIQTLLPLVPEVAPQIVVF